MKKPIKNLASRLAHHPIHPRIPAPMDHVWPTYVRLVPAGSREQGGTYYAAVTLRRTSFDGAAA